MNVVKKIVSLNFIMLIVENTLISDELVTVKFSCHYSQCMGMCCVAGDAGAPLEAEEILYLKKNICNILPFMSKEGAEVCKTSGLSVKDIEGNDVTALMSGGACIFVIYHNGNARCAIEEAYRLRKISFPKPVSCHLYPVRLTDYQEFVAVNYHKWDICRTALKKGRKDGVFLYRYLKEALIRKFGVEWYEALEAAAEFYQKNETRFREK